MNQADRIKIADEIDNFSIEGWDISIQSAIAISNLLGRASEALRASPPEALREGWKLVPMAPTTAMLEAGWKAGKDNRNYSAIREIHGAMYAAAPGRSEGSK